MDDELEIPRPRKAAPPKQTSQWGGIKVRVVRPVQLNSDAFAYPPERPQKLAPGDEVELVGVRAEQLVVKGVVVPV